MLEQSPKAILLNSEKLKKSSAEKLEKSEFVVSKKAAWSWDKETNTCSIQWADSEMETMIKIIK